MGISSRGSNPDYSAYNMVTLVRGEGYYGGYWRLLSDTKTLNGDRESLGNPTIPTKVEHGFTRRTRSVGAVSLFVL